MKGTFLSLAPYRNNSVIINCMKTYRIQVYNNTSVDLMQYLPAMFQYYQKHRVTFNYDITNVNVPVPQSTLAYNPLVGNVYVIQGAENLVPQTDHDIVLFFFDYSNWKAPWYWPWPLWGNIPRDCTYMANGKPFITIGYWSTDTTVAQRFIHEPMHALAKIFGCQDQMDNYLLDNQPDSPVGNFASQWAIFKPFIMPLQAPTNPVQPLSTPSVTITRLSDNGVETIGSLVATNNGATFTCSTLELPWKNNQHDISCIPKGTYQASVQPFHNTHMYELSPTEPRTGIFIHPGNYYKDSLGCILLGVRPSDINADGQVDVTSSVNTVSAFMSFMHNNDFTLTIN